MFLVYIDYVENDPKKKLKLFLAGRQEEVARRLVPDDDVGAVSSHSFGMFLHHFLKFDPRRFDAPRRDLELIFL